MRELIRDIRNRVMLSIARAVVSIVDDSKKMQSLQLSILKREVRNDVERFQNYGFSSHPKVGAEAAVIFIGGNRDLGLCIAVDDRRYRLTALQEGEVALYTDEGDKLVLKRGNVIEVTTHTFKVNASTKCEFTTPLATFSGNVTAQGDITDHSTGSGRSMLSMRTIYNGHTHVEHGSTTDAPAQQQ